MPDFYPNRFNDRGPWHTTFAAGVTLHAAALGASPGDLTQIAADRDCITLLIDWVDDVEVFRQAVTEYKDTMADGDPLEAEPGIPAAPAAPGIPAAALPGVQKRTRAFVARFKTAVGYNDTIGQDLGVIGTPDVLEDPSIASLVALAFSQVEVNIDKGGYEVIAIDMKRGAGDWEQIVFATNTPYIHVLAPSTPGQPEQREYRVQAVVNNQRVGPVSPPLVVVTTP